MADGAKDDVGRVAVTPLEIAAAEVPVALHVTDHGLDSRAAAELDASINKFRIASSS